MPSTLQSCTYCTVLYITVQYCTVTIQGVQMKSGCSNRKHYHNYHVTVHCKLQKCNGLDM